MIQPNWRQWFLGDGVTIHVGLPPGPLKLNRKQVERLVRYVEALGEESSIAWDDADKAEPEPEGGRK